MISNLDYKDSIITNNLLIGAMERKDNPPSTLFDPVVLLYMYSEYNAITDNV